MRNLISLILKYKEKFLHRRVYFHYFKKLLGIKNINKTISIISTRGLKLHQTSINLYEFEISCLSESHEENYKNSQTRFSAQKFHQALNLKEMWHFLRHKFSENRHCNSIFYGFL